jgi:hypothetical protein
MKKIIVIASTVYETLSYFHIDQAKYYAENGFRVELISSINSTQRKEIEGKIFSRNINFNANPFPADYIWGGMTQDVFHKEEKKTTPTTDLERKLSNVFKVSRRGNFFR